MQLLIILRLYTVSLINTITHRLLYLLDISLNKDFWIVWVSLMLVFHITITITIIIFSVDKVGKSIRICK